MKATLVRILETGEFLGQPSHVLALGGGRAVALSCFRRRLAYVSGDEVVRVDLAPLARRVPDGKADHDHRGAPFRHGDGFGVVYADVLHLFPGARPEPLTLPLDGPGATPLLACQTGEGALVAASHGFAAWSAERLRRVVWSGGEGHWLPGEATLDRSVLGDPDPPVIESMDMDGSGLLVHTTGARRNHARYGMAASALVSATPDGAVRAVTRVQNGYGLVAPDGVLLQLLAPRSGGLDYAVLARDGTERGTFRLTWTRFKTLAAKNWGWARSGFAGADYWFCDDSGNLGRFALED